VGQNVYVRGKPFKVVGVLKERGQVFSFDIDSIVYLPARTVQKKLLGTDYVLGVLVKTQDPAKMDELKMILLV